MQKAVVYLKDRLSDRFTGYGVSDDKPKTLSEAILAEEIANAFSSGYFRIYHSALYMFNGKNYIPCDADLLYRVLIKVLKDLDVGLVYRLDQTISKIRKRILGEDIPEFEASKSLIAFRNCVLDLNTGAVHDHSHTLMTRILLDFDYDAKAKCPRWNQFLVEVLSDEGQRKILQEFLGCVFIDRSQLNIETALFLFGNGSNGKGVVSHVMEFMLGSDNYSSADLAQLCTGNHSDYHVASIDGKLLNFASDMGTDDFSSGRYKAIVSHEPIQARQPGGKPYTAVDMPLIAASVNHLPVITDNSNGFWRRFCMLLFEKTFDEKTMDKTLKLKLESEISGIFNWVLEGRKRIIANNGTFTTSEVVEVAKDRAKRDSDSVNNFMSEFYYFPEVKPEMKNPDTIRVSSKDLYNKYKSYCLEAGFKAKGAKTFKDTLVRNGYQYKRSTFIDGVVTSGYQLVECTPSYEDLESFDEPELSADQIEAKKEEQKINELPF